MSTQRQSKRAADERTIDRLKIAHGNWERAGRALEHAERARALAVWEARSSGVGPRELGRILGLSHVRARQIAIWGEQLAAGAAPGTRPEAPGTRPESTHLLRAVPADEPSEEVVAVLVAACPVAEGWAAPASLPESTQCRRLGCSEPAGEGAYCDAHSRY